jgi:hypothetical protein
MCDTLWVDQYKVQCNSLKIVSTAFEFKLEKFVNSLVKYIHILNSEMLKQGQNIKPRN